MASQDIVALLDQLAQQGKKATHLLIVDVKVVPDDVSKPEKVIHALGYMRDARDRFVDLLDDTKYTSQLSKYDETATVHITWRAAARDPVGNEPVVFYATSIFNNQAVQFITDQTIQRLCTRVAGNLGLANQGLHVKVQFMVQKVIGRDVIGGNVQ